MNALTGTFTFPCPYCWETNECIADLSAEQQCYIEDCRVCCHPVQIRFSVIDNKPVNIETERAM